MFVRSLLTVGFMHLQESGEMYLETILLLTRKISNVRAIDVSEHMGYSKPSVSRALGILKNGGYITVDKSGYITLTDTGLDRAEKTYERHTVLAQLFTFIGVTPETASEDACKIEHVISDETFNQIKLYMNKNKIG